MTYYVSTDGDDTSGTGKMDSPWRTIGRASLEMKTNF